VRSHRIAEEEIARAGRKYRRGQAAEIAVDGREQRVAQIMTGGIKPRRPLPPRPDIETRTLSTNSSLALSESPSPVRSTHGLPGAIAAGSGTPSALARSIIVSVRPPPAEVPKMAILRGSVRLARCRQTAMASSSGAGKVNSGAVATRWPPYAVNPEAVSRTRDRRSQITVAR
jgi:hypothetical protein